MKKIVKTVIWCMILIALGVGGWKVYQDYQVFRNGDGTVYPHEFVEDTGRYSSQGGNTANGSDIYVNDKGEVTAYFRSAINRGAQYGSDFLGNLTTGKVYHGGVEDDIKGINGGFYIMRNVYDEVCIYDNTAYVTKFVGGKGDERYQFLKLNLKSGASTVLKEELVYNFMVANGTLYYQYSDGLYNMNTQTGEEKLVVADTSGDYFFHNGVLYYKKDGLLHSMVLESGETKQISEYKCDWFFMHQGRIYYEGAAYGMNWLMSMNPDGTNNQAHKIFDVTQIGEYNGKLYYIKTNENVEELFCIDLADSEFTEQQLSIKEPAAECLKNFYASNIEKRLRQFPQSDEGSEIIFANEFEGFSVGEGYILFQINSTVNKWSMNEAFLYDVNTEEVKLLNEMLGLDIIYDYYLR